MRMVVLAMALALVTLPTLAAPASALNQICVDDTGPHWCVTMPASQAKACIGMLRPAQECVP